MDHTIIHLLNDMCIECQDTKANWNCLDCLDKYCELCYHSQHKKGSRKKHTKEKIILNDIDRMPSDIPGSIEKSIDIENNIKIINNTFNSIHNNHHESNDLDQMSNSYHSNDQQIKDNNNNNNNNNNINININEINMDIHNNIELNEIEFYLSSELYKRSKYIPLRLNENERELFILLDACLDVSEYTDKIDILSYRHSHTNRILNELNNIYNTIIGMTITNNYHKGKKLIQINDIEDPIQNKEWIENIFEIGRRYKIMNPEKMRNNYGKMIYLLQDAASFESTKNDINMNNNNNLKFSSIKKIQTVYSFLKDHNILSLLEEPILSKAVWVPLPYEYTLKKDIEIKKNIKEKSILYLCNKYTLLNSNITKKDIERCIYSIEDNNNYLSLNNVPIKKMISYLNLYFSNKNNSYSLAISAGMNGSRLTHSHSTQFQYCYQSLLLWYNFTNEMFRLWYVAEKDLLKGQLYRLRDTGQGLNRMQKANNTYNVAHEILERTQKEVGNTWIGSSMIHLGDHNVPNAFMFIDKYTQISRIIGPIVNTIENIDILYNKNQYIVYFIDKSYESCENLKKIILSDFFKHAFDGSGADNFFDAGSCIDGRLTSAWNWCSKIEKKKYYPIFLLTGFSSFDGCFDK